MKRLVCKMALISMILISILLFTACESESTPTATLNVYNWGEYISDGSLGTYDVNQAFEEFYYEKYGVRIKVNYSTYSTNEDMYSKISGGAGSYDVLFPSDYMLQRMIEEDMLLPFDATTLENFKYIDQEYTGLYFDPDNLYSVPYTYGKVGIIYNTTMVDEADVESMSWDIMWNEKYSGKILQFNNPRDAMATAMFLMGLDINSNKTAEWDLCLEKLIEQKPYIQAYVSDEIFNKMISNSASIAPYYVGDFITMLESNPDLAFYYPSEGTNVFVDAMCIPKNSKNPEIAKEYINFLLSEEPAVANALYIGYASPNSLVYNNEDYINEMGEDAIDILYGTNNGTYEYDPYYHSFTPELQAYTNSLWESLKTQNSTELWVHISSILIVGSLCGFGGYSIYIKKKRSRDYRIRDKQKRMNK